MVQKGFIMENKFNASLDLSDIYYTYDGSFDGLLTVIHTAVYSRIVPKGIFTEDLLQLSFNARYIKIETDSEKATKVMKAVNMNLGKNGSRRLYYVFLSDFPEKDMIIYKYMMLGFKNGIITNAALSDDTVASAFKIAENVSRETEKFRQFVRFSVMDWGVQYARFVPKNNILPILTPFFVNRLKIIPFVLHDLTHDLCAVYDTKNWYITSSEGLTMPDISENEKKARELWQAFFDAISIKERKNPKLQKQMMPARYFKDVWTIK